MERKTHKIFKKSLILILSLVITLLLSAIVYFAVSEYRSSTKLRAENGDGYNANEEETSVDRDYWEWHTRTTTNDNAYNGEHIVMDGDKFTFYGYGQTSYKDYLYKYYDRAGVKTFNLTIDEVVANYHTLEGAGFIFNASKSNDLLSGYILLMEESFIRLYRLQDINSNQFETGANGTVANYGNMISSAKKPTTSVHNLRIIAMPTKVIVYDNEALLMDVDLSYENHKGEDFGLVVSYVQHDCSQLSTIEFSNFSMSIEDFIIPVKKVDEDGNGLQGAEFQVKNADKEVIRTGVTGEDGIWNIPGLVAGAYTLEETKQPEGCKRDLKSYGFSVNAEGKALSIITGQEIDLEVENELLKIELTKYEEETTNPIQGAKFILLNEDQTQATNIYDEKCEAITDQDGKFYFKGIRQGVYYVKETEVPEGYELSDKLYRCIVYENGTINYVDMQNQIIYNSKLIELAPGAVTIIKYEEETAKPLEGAVIGFYKENGEKLLDTDGNAIELTTNINGEVDLASAITKIKPGKYKYKEIRAPIGYDLNDTIYEFEIRNDGTAIFTNEDNSDTSRGVIYNKVSKADITANKVWDDEDNKENKRPASVILKILKNGEEAAREEVNEEKNWSFTASLPIYDENKNLINYTVDEEEVNESDLRFYKKEINNYTVTNKYTVPENSNYKIEHYLQKDTLDGYELHETETLTGKTNSIVTATPKNYDGYILNPRVQGTIEKGKILADGSLVLKLYYDKIVETNFNINLVNVDAETGKPIQNSKYDIIIRYNDGTTEEFLEQRVDTKGNIKINNVVAKNITKVCIKQTLVPSTYLLDENEQYVEIEVNNNKKIQLTGSKSENVTASVEDDTLNIIHMNYKLRGKNAIRINAVDGIDSSIKIGDVKFIVTFPDGREQEVTTNEQGIAEIPDIPVPGEGAFTYEIRQKNTIDGYKDNTTPIYVEITFGGEGVITNVRKISGNADTELLEETVGLFENKIANITIKQERTEQGPFGDYDIKIIEKDKDTGSLVEGVTYKIVQKGTTSGNTSTLSTIKTTDASGQILLDALNDSELVIKVVRTRVQNPYVLLPEEIEIILERDTSGEYVIKTPVDGVTIDTGNNLIIINREIFKNDSPSNLARSRINNTIYITKVDKLLRPLQGITLELREASTGTSWELLTDENGLAKITDTALVQKLGSEFPQYLMDKEGTLTFWITEKTVPSGFERIDEDIGFEVKYAINPDGGLEITSMNVLDGLSYYHIVDQEYDQYLEDEYTQVDIKMKVINNYGNNNVIKELKIEKVDSKDKSIKLANVAFKVVLEYENDVKLTTEGITDKDGILIIPELMLPQAVTTIKIIEISAPDEYEIDKTPITITVTNENGDLIVEGAVLEEDTISVQVENVKIQKPYDIYIRKRDKNTSGLISAAAIFEVTITDSTGVDTKTLSTTNGLVKIEELNSKGNITIQVKEIQAPIGYEINNEITTAYLIKNSLAESVEMDTSQNQNDVSVDDDIVYIDFYNEEKEEDDEEEEDKEDPILVIKKVDEDNTKLPLSGAKFQITNPNNDTKMLTTSSTGEANMELSELLSGRYTIEEIEAPKDYEITKKLAVDLNIDEDKNVTSCDIVKGLGEEYLDDVVNIKVTDKKVTITISDKKNVEPLGPYTIIIDKISKGDNKKLEGARFDINLQGGTNYMLTEETKGTEGIVLEGLSGTGEINVSIQEIKEPEGYKKDEKLKEFKFTRDEETGEITLDTNSLKNIEQKNIKINEQTITVTIENEPIVENLLTIENEDLDDNSIKIDGTTFEVLRLDSTIAREITNSSGLIEDISLGLDKDTTVEYLIKNINMSNTDYLPNEDVVLQIEYDADGKMKSANIISGDKDDQNRVVAQIDSSVDYVGKNKIKIIIRCEKLTQGQLLIQNEDIEDNSIKIRGTTFEVYKLDSSIARETTNSSGLTKEMNLGLEENTTVEYLIKNINMTDTNYKKNEDVTLRITYNQTGKMLSAEIVSGEKDSKNRIVAEIDSSVDYKKDNKIKLIIRCEKYPETKLIIENEDIDDSSIKIAGTTFEITETADGVISETTDSSGLTKEIILGVERDTVKQYLIRNTNMDNEEYKNNEDIEIEISYNSEGKINYVNIISNNVDLKGRIFAQIDESTDYLNSNEIKLIIRCEKYPESRIIIQNEDIDDNSIKISGTIFEISKRQNNLGSGTTNRLGITEEISLGSAGNTKVSYTIRTTKIQSMYNANADVTLEIEYDNEGKMLSASITGGERDSENRVVAQIDTSVDYVGNQEIKIIIRCEKIQDEEDDEEEQDDFEVTLEKVSKNNASTKVVGAKYSINILNEKLNEEITKIENTNSVGQISLPDIKGYGDFTITINELESPAGYMIDENEHIIRINIDEQTKALTILEEKVGTNATVILDKVNNVIKVVIEEQTDGRMLGIIKKDYDDEKILLKDCKFTITEGDFSEELITGANGIAEIELPERPDGKFTFIIKEIENTSGYDLLEEELKLGIIYSGGSIISVDIGDTENAYISEQTGDYIEVAILNKKSEEQIETKYDIELTKTDAYYTNIVIPNAEIKIDVDNEFGMKGITKTELTDSNGKIQINDIYGNGNVTILITELNPPPGRKFDTKEKQVVLNIDPNNGWIRLDKQTKNVDVDIDNENKKISIRIRNYPDGIFYIGANKVDEKDENLLLKGAEYTVTREDTGETFTLEELIDGLLLSPEISFEEQTEEVKEYTYKIIENKAPSGYMIDTTPIILKVEVTKLVESAYITNAYIESGNASITEFGDGYVQLKLKDKKASYDIALKKVDNIVKDYGIANTKIKVHVKAESGEEYEEILETNENGQINLEGLQGTGRIEVTIEEIEASPNYIKDDEIKTIIFTRNEIIDEETGNVSYEITIDEVIGNKISVTEKNGIIDIIFENELDLEKAMYIKVIKKWVDTEEQRKDRPENIKIQIKNGDEVVKEIVISNTDQEVTFTDLPRYDSNGNEIKYTIAEAEVNEGDLDEYEASIDENTNTITNTHKEETVNVRIKKVIKGTDIGLQGATIVLIDENGEEKTAVTNKDGYVIFTDLETGKEYQYKEIKQPIGYILNGELYKFRIDSEGNIEDIYGNRVIENERINSIITIKKYETNTNTPLAGATIKIYNSDRVEIAEFTTNEYGEIKFRAEPGKYYYQEVIAPEGYELNNTMYEFTVNENGTVTFKDNEGIIYNNKKEIDNPGEDPGDNPGEDPGDNPGEDPGDNPGEDPGDNPGEDPGDNPGEDPGDNPGENPNDNNNWNGSGSNGSSGNNGSNSNSNNGNSSNSNDTGEDNNKNSNIPYAGTKLGVLVLILISGISGVIFYSKYSMLKEIK